VYEIKNAFSYMSYAKLVFSANKVPETFDETTAFFSPLDYPRLSKPLRRRSGEQEPALGADDS
jgi:hypothetical protein